MNCKLRLIGTVVVLALIQPIHALSAPTLIELTADANRPAVNDLVRSTVFAEATGSTANELSKQVSKLIADALRTAKSYPGIKVQSSGTSTYPNYSKSGKIDSWRMRSDLLLESSDTAAMSDLLGKLQSTLGVSSLVLLPSPETRKTAENEAILDAITAFKVRAKVIADALGQRYHIKQLSVNSSSQLNQPVFRAAAKSMALDATPMPMEAGDTQVNVNISGQIELE